MRDRRVLSADRAAKGSPTTSWRRSTDWTPVCGGPEPEQITREAFGPTSPRPGEVLPAIVVPDRGDSESTLRAHPPFGRIPEPVMASAPVTSVGVASRSNAERGTTTT